MKSRELARRQWAADRRGAHPKLLEFEKRFLAKARRAGIPLAAACFVSGGPEALFPRAADALVYQRGLAVCLVHGVKGFDLSDKAWSILGHLGSEASRQGGLSVIWGGASRPYHWEHRDWQELQGGFPFARDERFWR